MRVFFSRIIKPMLAVAAAVLMVQSLQACSKTPAQAENPAPAEKPTQAAAAPKAPEVKRGPDGVRLVDIAVTEAGYEPSPITLKKDEPVKLVVTRKTDHTCATEVVMEEYGIDTKLPLNTPVEIAFTPTKTGELRYGCAMGKMISGAFMVE
ncbi:cupredoxin domain-containing protein [Myxococcaceae bacterium GXIMD 01537]